ncbi:unnamed protein product [Didymodactylos carnosus]|uniref:Potassium channel tetramerisation-type BTB domain-containing protein n=1 Tax=Didymodactylos carnosus TaxID=1234261 RepID=A0A816BUZ2_9BILA|nr:unnamed protein product [Didymodactylos carnosus]CAF1612283.1 unnamed protein product [Didymodactylos carnosus]CAF4232183.1 unnamed protein product [Didymodactylos carnosus]CAF4496117.1 unnamed protein product [Didymodactylos carnosus]
MNDNKTVQFKLTNGQIYGIFLDHLNKYPDSFLTKLVLNEGLFHSKYSGGDYFLLDEDPSVFASILQFYRYDTLLLPVQFEKLKNNIIDKYLLPDEISAEVSQKLPFYVVINDFSADKTETLITPHPSNIPELKNGYPFLVNHYGRLQKTNYVDVVNYLTSKGYQVEQWDCDKRHVLMKKM